MSDFWATHQRVIVTGGAGFLGQHLCALLRAAGIEPVVPRSRDYDLRTPAGIQALLQSSGPVDVMFHLAATVGGIGATATHPAEYFYDNAAMGIHLIHEAHRHGVGKLIVAGSVCAYPKFAPTPFNEDNLWLGEPEETNAPYGVAKRMLVTQLHAYRQQYGFNGVYLLLANLYGPGDDFAPETSHVIPALMRRFAEARDQGAESVTVWGSGRASRDFLYVKDAAAAFMAAAEHYDESFPVNVGSGTETSIGGLVGLIAQAVGYHGRIQWDASKPDGQPRRVLWTGRALHNFGWKAQTPLAVGLREMVAWWDAQREAIPA
jgi:GDP-L-fucose synthase